ARGRPLAGPDPEDRRRPRDGAGGHGDDAGHSQPVPRRKDPPDLLGDAVRPEVRHADDEHGTGPTLEEATGRSRIDVEPLDPSRRARPAAGPDRGIGRRLTAPEA